MLKNKKYAGKAKEELRKIYRDAWREGIWIREFGRVDGGGRYMAAAGSVEELEEIEKKLGREIEISELSLGDCVNLAQPGTGKTRAKACRNAVEEFKKHRKRETSKNAGLF